MKDGEPQEAAISISPPTITATSLKKDSSVAGLFNGKNGYKFWVLAAILLLAFWSMFTGSVSLKWLSGDLTSFSNEADLHIDDDLDILEVEEREKMVRRMWDVYAQSRTVRLPRFWREAFEAAYEYLVSDSPSARDAAVSEIAKLSVRSLNLETLPLQPTDTRETTKTIKQAEESKQGVVTAGTS